MAKKTPGVDPSDNGQMIQPGMDTPIRNRDSGTWPVESDLFFSGRFVELGTNSGPEVGNPYDVDEMGEERAMITYLPNAKKGKVSK